MVWLDRKFGDTSPLFSASFVSRQFVRIIVVFVALFAAFSAKPENGGPDQLHGLLNATSAAETLARWLQPSTAAAATRKRQRAASTRAQANKTAVASETSPEPSAPVLAPLTPFIQIWPQAHAVKSDASEAMTQLRAQDFMHVAEKGDRLIPLSGSEEEDVVQADELSELDRAAAPLQQPEAAEARAQAVAFTDTDGRAAPRDNGDTTMPVNRFAAFAESLKAIPQAPWFDSLLFVFGGAIAAFIAARVFMRA